MSAIDSLQSELLEALRRRIQDPECPPAVYTAAVALIKSVPRGDVGAEELSAMITKYAPKVRQFGPGSRA